jgi:glycine betaine/proline transport system ATP-binding protein
VLTASSVMEKPVATLGRDQGPRVAHRLMREHQQHGLYVTGRDRSLVGYVTEDVVNKHLEDSNLSAVLEPITTVVGADTPVAELFAPAAHNQLPLPVVDDDKRLIGVIPRVTLLAALGAQTETPLDTELAVPGRPDDEKEVEGVL